MTSNKKKTMRLTDLELHCLLAVPMTFDVLYAAMINNNIGTDERRAEIRNEADRLRQEMGV